MKNFTHLKRKIHFLQKIISSASMCLFAWLIFTRPLLAIPTGEVQPDGPLGTMDNAASLQFLDKGSFLFKMGLPHVSTPRLITGINFNAKPFGFGTIMEYLNGHPAFYFGLGVGNELFQIGYRLRFETTAGHLFSLHAGKKTGWQFVLLSYTNPLAGLGYSHASFSFSVDSRLNLDLFEADNINAHLAFKLSQFMIEAHYLAYQKNNSSHSFMDNTGIDFSFLLKSWTLQASYHHFLDDYAAGFTVEL